jgi:hypothetical protein
MLAIRPALEPGGRETDDQAAHDALGTIHQQLRNACSAWNCPAVDSTAAYSNCYAGCAPADSDSEAQDRRAAICSGLALSAGGDEQEGQDHRRTVGNVRRVTDGRHSRLSTSSF